MHPLLADLSKRFDPLETRAELLAAISDLEDAYDSFSEIDQETVAKLLDALTRRLKEAKA